MSVKELETHLSVAIMAFGRNCVQVRQVDAECVNIVVGEWPRQFTLTLTNEDAVKLRDSLVKWSWGRDERRPYPNCPTAPAADETVELTEEGPK